MRSNYYDRLVSVSIHLHHHSVEVKAEKATMFSLFNHYVELWDDVSRLGKLVAVTCGIFSTSTSSCFCFLHGLLVLHTWIVILGFKDVAKKNQTKEFVSPRQFAFEAKTQIDPPRLIGCQEIVKYHAGTTSTSPIERVITTMVIRENRVFNYR